MFIELCIVFFFITIKIAISYNGVMDLIDGFSILMRNKKVTICVTKWSNICYLRPAKQNVLTSAFVNIDLQMPGVPSL